MKKSFGKLMAGVMIAVMTVSSLPSIAYAGELLISEDTYCFETEEGMDDTELIEEESAPDVELSEETLDEVILSDETIEETLDEVILSDETIEESFDGEAEYELSSEEPIFWITNKNNPAGKECELSEYTIKNGDALTLSVVPKWENIGETNPDDIPVTYTWYITDCYTGVKQKVEGNNTDSYTLPTDLVNNNKYQIDCEASAEYNSKSDKFSFLVCKHDEGINPWVNGVLSFSHGQEKDLSDYNMSWDEENNILILSGAYIKLQNYMLLPANSTIVVEEGTTNYIYGRVTFNGEGTITGEGTLNIINENSAGDCIKFCDATGSVVSTYLDEDGYVVIHYDEVKNASVPYDAVDWRFDQNAYMGYTVKELRFENPGAEYPDNVLKMTMNLYSVKYGEYQSTYYIKCIGVDEIRWES